MAFSASNAGIGSGGFGAQAQTSTSAQVQDGPELQEIQTDQLGFSALNGDAKVRLLPSPWPADSLPPPTSSLLSIASSKGFLAAAGPETLIFASTEKVRNAFTAEGGSSTNVKPFQAAVEIAVPRLSQVAFSADETVLVVSPQEVGGLVVYQVGGLENGRTDPALQISTNNTGLRALIPNPVPESAELFAAVTTNGELLMADLKSGQLKSGSSGPVLKTGVSCLSWSNRGKQLIAGLADGTAVQLKPDGTVVAHIPKSTSILGDMHMSAVSWLENDSFFAVYTPNAASVDGMTPPSEFYIISRQPKSSDYTFQKLPEVCGPFGLDRAPSSQFITRLRNFPPHLQDLLVVTATTAIDIALLSKSDVPLSKEEPVIGAFTLTSINDDTRRAQFPLSESSGDTSPIGVALDLSSKEVVGAPIPSDPEIQQSATPLPNLLVLTHEGILVSWWIVYNDSIREKTLFSGFASASGSQQTQPQTTPTQPIAAAPTSAFGQSGLGKSGFGSTPSLGNPAANTFGAPAGSSTPVTQPGSVFDIKSTTGGGNSSWTSTGFGSNSNQQSNSSGFGQPAFGSRSTPQPKKPGFGQPALGSSTPVDGVATPAFGAVGSFNNRQSPFGKAPLSSVPGFGQSGFGAQTGGAFGGAQVKSPFATASGPPSSGFGAFSNSNGFSALGPAKKEGESVFGQAESSLFSKPGGSPFGGMKLDSQSNFGGAQIDQGKGAFSVSSGGFKIQSSFQGDGSAKDDLPKPADGGGFGFGGKSFNDLLGEGTNNALSPTHNTEAEMDEKEDDEHSDSQDEIEQDNAVNASQNMVTPPSTIIQHKVTPAPPLSNLFGPSSQTQTTPVASQNAGTGWSFGTLPSTTPKDTPGPSHLNMFGTTNNIGTTPAEVQKSEPSKTFGDLPSPPTPKPILLDTQPPPKEASQKAPRIKAEPPSDDETTDLRDIPEAPLPPDPTSKASYSPGDTSVSSINSKVPDETSIPPDFVPANRTAVANANEAELPEDDDEFSSEFDGSGEDVTEEISPIEEHQADQTEQLLTSPESSFGRGGDRSNDESPTGGLFTKVTSTHSKKPIPRSLFGEVTSGTPIFPPPKLQESPRSPSPVRNVLPINHLRPEAPRSFSAPIRPPALEKRKAELAKSSMALQAAREKEEHTARDQARAAAIVRAQSQAEAEAAQSLEDDEDERLRTELEEPLEPCPSLDAFLPHQPVMSEEVSKSGIPGQIERLYQDINSMIVTIGINARSLSAFMAYQQSHDQSMSLPDILKSENPMDALDQDWLLDDAFKLRESEAVLNGILDTNRLSNAAGKLQNCQTLIGKEISDLRSKLMTMRKSLHVRADPALTTSAPLSSEQASTQQDLRKASIAVQTRLARVEESLSVLRAKLAEVAPLHENIRGVVGRGLGRSVSQKKPTVEAVTNTIAKMTSMAEKKSADIDLLEAQLKRLNFHLGDSVNGSRQSLIESDGTPQKGKTSTYSRSTGSAANSVYHTPDSKFGGSVRSTPGTGRRSLKSSVSGRGALVSAEDREKWQVKAHRKKEVAAMMKEALRQKKGQS